MYSASLYDLCFCKLKIGNLINWGYDAKPRSVEVLGGRGVNLYAVLNHQGQGQGLPWTSLRTHLCGRLTRFTERAMVDVQ